MEAVVSQDLEFRISDTYVLRNGEHCVITNITHPEDLKVEGIGKVDVLIIASVLPNGPRSAWFRNGKHIANQDLDMMEIVKEKTQ